MMNLKVKLPRMTQTQTVGAKAEAERPKEKARSIAKLPKAKPEVNQKAKLH